MFRGFHTNREDACLFGIQSQLLQQNRLPYPAQTNQQDAFGSVPNAYARNGYTHLFPQLATAGEIRRWRAGTRRITDSESGP